MKEQVLENIKLHKERLSRLNDGQIWWDDKYVLPFTKMYKQNRNEYIQALDNIMCDVNKDEDVRFSAYNLYDLIWFSEKDDRKNITQHLRNSFYKLIDENDNDIRGELLCFISKVCTGSDDDLLFYAYQKTKNNNNSSFETVLSILKEFELAEQISESQEMLYMNFRNGFEHISSFKERMKNFKDRFPNEDPEKRKKNNFTTVDGCN